MITTDTTTYESVIESIQEEILERLLEDERFINLVGESLEQRWKGLINLDGVKQNVREELYCLEQITVGKSVLDGIFK